MTYLMHYARLPETIAPRRPPTRIAENLRLNRPGLYGDAYVHVLVEDTRGRRRRGRRDPLIALQIADCVNTINLEFALGEPHLRENALFKVDTLIDALSRFREALAAEAELAEHRAARR